MDKLALKFKKNYLLNKNHYFISHCYLISHVLFYFILFYFCHCKSVHYAVEMYLGTKIGLI